LNTYYYYYFLMNVSTTSNPQGDQNAPGPIPVGAPISGQLYLSNGFATGSTTDKNGIRNGFTDFVLFTDQAQYPGSLARQGFGLYHVAQGADSNNRLNFQANGAPITMIRPSTDQNDPTSAQISFEVDLAQLFPYITDQVQLQNAVKNLRWIEINAVATDIVPTDTQTSVVKQYDSFGDTSDGVGNFLVLDVSQPIQVVSGSTAAGSASEPAGDANDVFASPPGSVAPGQGNRLLNIKSWEIDIVQN
ncbi:MAG TPA: hypothetical protein VKU00_29070, partial [Chthonomonadaceae bacterium]|nr:hypothetical protein [Chthonomonadaceae bacterium]